MSQDTTPERGRSIETHNLWLATALIVGTLGMWQGAQGGFLPRQSAFVFTMWMALAACLLWFVSLPEFDRAVRVVSQKVTAAVEQWRAA